MTLAEQLGNIGSEVGRAISWRERGNVGNFEGAFVRMLELLDLTLADDRWRGAKRRELARVREALCAAMEEGAPTAPLPAWNRYFSHFAAMARAQRGF